MIAGCTRSIVLAITSVGLAGCGTMSDGRRWGEDTTLAPGWERAGRAARDAALDPRTWVPAVGAGVMAIGDLDEEVSDPGPRARRRCSDPARTRRTTATV